MRDNIFAAGLALLAAMCYGISVPVSRALLDVLPPTFLAALLYLGATLSVLPVRVYRRTKQAEAVLARSDIPFALCMVVLDIFAPILLLLGLKTTPPATASLLNNFEVVVTALIALFVFREAIGRRMWLAIAAITLASMVLSLAGAGRLTLSPGALLVLLACCCWGLENNITNKLSLKDPTQIVLIKGVGAGMGALLIAAVTGGIRLSPVPVMQALLLGAVAYGLSILLYVMAQRRLGAARTSAYYAAAPFMGVALSFAMYGTLPETAFYIALPMMAVGAVLAAMENHVHLHGHTAMTHTHRHTHTDLHHAHRHAGGVRSHSHLHVHEAMEHQHPHTPDAHHQHQHPHTPDAHHLHDHEKGSP